MTGPKLNSEFFLVETVIKCFVIPPNSKIEQIIKICTNITQICRSFKVHDLIKSESKVQVVVSLGS